MENWKEDWLVVFFARKDKVSQAFQFVRRLLRTKEDSSSWHD